MRLPAEWFHPVVMLPTPWDDGPGGDFISRFVFRCGCGQDGAMAKKTARKAPAKKSPQKRSSGPVKAAGKAGAAKAGAKKTVGAGGKAGDKRPAAPAVRRESPRAPSAPTSTIRPVLRPAGSKAKAAGSGTLGVYSVHPGVQMMIKWAAELPSKTGRSLDQWVALVEREAPKDTKGRIAWLQSRHKMGTNSAWWIAERAEGKGAEDLDPELYLRAAEAYVEEQYAGKKAALRLLYDSLLSLCRSLGADARACPCKTIVPIYRKHVIAQIKPTTNTRIDLGLALGDTRATGPLIDTGGFAKKDRITHRVEITSEASVTPEVRSWLAAAYERDA